jgi:type IV pilus assembly protein PilM
MKQLFSRYFPTPSYLNMDACAFDISDESIKYGQLSETVSGFKLEKFGKEKIPEGVMVAGKIEDEKKLIDILKNIRVKEKLNFARISLPEQQMYVFTLSLPQMHGQDLREMIFLQIEEHIPLKANEVVFDYDTISEDEKSTIVEVLAVSVEVIEGYLSVFKRAGLSPISFEIEAQAITRAVVPRGENSTVMIVDFGYISTGVSISHNGNVLFTTTLDIGGYNLTEMLAKNFSLSFEKAEEMKKSYNLGNATKSNDIFPVILNGISVLHDELDKQYIYWKTHSDNSGFAHEKIDRIILCGGNANLSGLAEYLEASMKIKVEYANAWINISDMKITVPEMSFEDSLSYVTVLGLALGSFSHEAQSVINVLPPEEKKALRSQYWARLMTIFFNLLSLTGVLAILLLVPSYLLSVSKESLAEERLELFNLNNPEITTLNIDKAINDINSKLSLLSSQEIDQQISEKVFGWLLKNKPNGVTFSQLLYSRRTDGVAALEVHGMASNRAVLRDFKTILDGNINYAEVNLPISDFLEKNNLPFTISIIIK